MGGVHRTGLEAGSAPNPAFLGAQSASPEPCWAGGGFRDLVCGKRVEAAEGHGEGKRSVLLPDMQQTMENLLHSLQKIKWALENLPPD